MNNRRKLVLGAGAAGVAGIAGGLWWQRSRDDAERDAEHAMQAGPPPQRDPAFPNALRLPGAEGMYGVIDVSGPRS